MPLRSLPVDSVSCCKKPQSTFYSSLEILHFFPLKWLVTMNYILFAAHTLPDTRVSADRVCWWKGLQDVASVLKARVKVVCREFPDALGLTTLGGFTGQRSWALRAIWEQRTVSETPTYALRPCASSTHELKPNISRATHYTPSWHEWTPNTWMFSSFLSPVCYFAILPCCDIFCVSVIARLV